MQELRTAIYIRVSSQEQAKGKCSIPTQQADIERHCQRQNDIIVKSYVDILSGRDAHKDREQFEQMLKDARAGLFDKIVVWWPDRLFRGLTPAAKLAQVLDETGIQIEGVLQPIDRRMIGLWAWVAEQEIEAMKDRFSAGKRGVVQQGNWSGGSFIRYGYRYNADRLSEEYTGKLEVDEQEARHLVTMFEKVDSNMKLRQLAQWLHKEGIPAKRGGKWTAQHLRDLLRDRTYISEGTYGKLTRKGNRFVKSNNTVPVPYPPIIQRDLFDRVQTRLALERYRP